MSLRRHCHGCHRKERSWSCFVFAPAQTALNSFGHRLLVCIPTFYLPHAKSAISNHYMEAGAHWKELFQYYVTQAFALGSANMKQHRLYLISSSVEVRVRSIALITCRMTNEAAPGVKGGEEKVRQRKELADCGKAVLEDGCLKDTQPDERPLLLFPVLFCFFQTFLHFLLLPGFFLEACTSLEGLINESTWQQPANTSGIRAREKNYL